MIYMTSMSNWSHAAARTKRQLPLGPYLRFSLCNGVEEMLPADQAAAQHRNPLNLFQLMRFSPLASRGPTVLQMHPNIWRCAQVLRQPAALLVTATPSGDATD